MTFPTVWLVQAGVGGGGGCGTDMATDTDADMDTDRDEVVWRCIKAGSSKFSFYLFCKVLRQNWAHCSTTLTPFPSSFCLACDSVWLGERVMVVSRACRSLVAGNTTRCCICRIRFAPLAQHNCFLLSCRAEPVERTSWECPLAASCPAAPCASRSSPRPPDGQQRQAIMTT